MEYLGPLTKNWIKRNHPKPVETLVDICHFFTSTLVNSNAQGNRQSQRLAPKLLCSQRMICEYKNLLNLIVLLICLTAGFSAKAGGASTGGGGAFVCTNSDGTILSSELIDLWEGIHIKKRNIPYTDEPVDQQIYRAISKLESLDWRFFHSVVKNLYYIRSHVAQMGADIDIAPPLDAQNTYQKPNCPPRGMMLFDGETEHLSVKPEIFEKLLNNTNVAAAWVHEAIYKSLRDNDRHENSIKARNLTSCLFAIDNCLKVQTLEEVLPIDRKVYSCTVPGAPISFYFFQESITASSKVSNASVHNWTAYLTHFGGPLPKLAFKSVLSITVDNTDHSKFNTTLPYFSKEVETPLSTFGHSLGSLGLTLTFGPGADPTLLPQGLAIDIAHLGDVGDPFGNHSDGYESLKPAGPFAYLPVRCQ
ncbi:MAG: hypothetical protein JNM39_07085 [Bdellovibrionaceae bacterium]|nr:hypothetical protein [Pseudobdellovibrionaceae bacterium]